MGFIRKRKAVMSKIVLSVPTVSPLRQWSLCAAALFCGMASAMASGVESKFRGEAYVRKVPIHFEPQPDGKFISRGLGYSLQLGPDEVVLRVDNTRAKPGATSSLVFRAIGPSLTGFGVAGALQDPALSVVDGNGAVVRTNDNWRTDQEAELIATTIQPSHEAEAAVVVNLIPGNYTAIVSGTGSTTGIGLVEVYNLGAVSSRR
jgi:hypothetical protein